MVLAIQGISTPMDNLNFDQLRSDYEDRGFDESDLDPCPIAQFQKWFAEAKKHVPGPWFEANAMTLSTTNGRGAVAARVVLLKQIEKPRGFLFFTNYNSDKGRHLHECPGAALNFHWPYLARQVRVTGIVELADAETSREYFHSRPRGSQIGALASDQSTVLKNRGELEAKFREIEQRYSDQQIPWPENWGGYWLSPHTIEFWQGRSSRMHDRLRFEKVGDQWRVERLSP